MKKAICGFLLFLTFVTVCFAQQDDSDTDGKNKENVILKAGTHISAQLQGVLGAENSHNGDDFVLNLTEDVTGNGMTFEKGTEVLGRVVRVKQITDDDDESEISLSFDFLKHGDDYLPFKAIIISAAPDSALHFDSSPIFKGATVISGKAKNVRLEEGVIFKLELYKDLLKP